MLDLNIEILIENTILKKTRNPKLLGVTLDEKMTFQDHVKAVELKAQKMLSALRIFGKRERIEPANIVKLYKSILVPQLEYAASMWQSGKCEILDRVQRMGSCYVTRSTSYSQLGSLRGSQGVRVNLC